MRKNVKCFVDVDEKKIRAKYYVNKEIGVKLPVVHFSELAKNDSSGVATQSSILQQNGEEENGYRGSSSASTALPNSTRIQKERKTEHVAKKQRRELSSSAKFSHLPVIVCVAMYRTNGALESNVRSVGRTEGVNLWHFI